MGSPMDPKAVRLNSKEEALNWVVDEIVEVERYRAQLAEAYKHPDARVGLLRKKFQKFLVVYGAAMGNLVALWRLGYITDDQYNQLRVRNDAVLVTATSSLHDLFD